MTLQSIQECSRSNKEFKNGATMGFSCIIFKEKNSLECLFLLDLRRIATRDYDNFTLTACKVSNAVSRGQSISEGYSLVFAGIDYGIPRFSFAIENTFISISLRFDTRGFNDYYLIFS